MSGFVRVSQTQIVYLTDNGAKDKRRRFCIELLWAKKMGLGSAFQSLLKAEVVLRIGPIAKACCLSSFGQSLTSG